MDSIRELTAAPDMYEALRAPCQCALCFKGTMCAGEAIRRAILARVEVKYRVELEVR